MAKKAGKPVPSPSAEALKSYRETSDPAIIKAVASFNGLKTADNLELLYFMICNTNMLVSAGAQIALGAAPAESE